MNCYLIKCHAATPFRRFDPIVCEPLELEYLSALLQELGCTVRLHDPLLDRLTLGRFLRLGSGGTAPDLVLLSGYNTAVPEMLAASKLIRKRFPRCLVAVGGVHAETCAADFYVDSVDLVFGSPALRGLRQLVERLLAASDLASAVELHDNALSLLCRDIPGLSWRCPAGWQSNPSEALQTFPVPRPDRAFFRRYASRTHYLQYRPLALVKGSLSCPHSCSFCYCRQLNDGRYLRRSAQDILEEVAALDSPTVWLADDCLIDSREQAAEWLAALRANPPSRLFIAYARADFIAANPDIFGELAGFGFREWIVGLEAVSDSVLADMDKRSIAEQNARAVAVLQSHGVAVMALFLVMPDFGLADFASLRKWIGDLGLRDFTFSIFTPLRGSSGYRQWQDRIVREDPHRYDFLHLVVKPTRLAPWRFYLEFWKLQLFALRRSSRRRYLVLRR